MSVELLAKLSERFPVEDVKQRTQGRMKLDYISIDATIRRLNEVLGVDWSFNGYPSKVEVLPSGQFMVVYSGELSALGKQASGVGADVAGDLDKALKTALAEALKKAGHQFGIGLYLWQEDERAEVERQRKVVSKSGANDASTPIKLKDAVSSTAGNDFGNGSF